MGRNACSAYFPTYFAPNICIIANPYYGAFSNDAKLTPFETTLRCYALPVNTSLWKKE